jgi:nicotinamide phosphoribosyltransferase
MKATYGELLDEIEDGPGQYDYVKTGREIFKDPKTDDGTKKSARGLLSVVQNEEGELVLRDRCTWEEEKQGLLETVFLDGELVRTSTLAEIRTRINNQL